MLCDLKSGVGAMRMVDATGQQGTVISRAPTPGITRDERGTRPAEEAKVCSAETLRPRQGKEAAQATQPVSVAEPGVGGGGGGVRDSRRLLGLQLLACLGEECGLARQLQPGCMANLLISYFVCFLIRWGG